MSVEVQIRRGAAASIAANTPAQGELWFNETTNQIHVGDGSTAGGWAQALANRVSISDANYTALATDRIVAYTGISASRTVTLPAASAYPQNAVLTVADENGAVSPSKTIAVTPAGTDLINGAASPVAIQVGYGAIALVSNGANAWIVLSQPALPASPHGATFRFQWIEQLVTCSGATTAIPLGATVLIFAVALNVVTTVTGCTSITINDSQNTNGHWGSGIGVSAGSTNAAGATPGPYYNGATTLALAAVGGGASFTGGTVRVSVLCMVITPPVS